MQHRIVSGGLQRICAKHMQREPRSVGHRTHQGGCGTCGTRCAALERIEKGVKAWLLQAPAQHRQEAQSVALDVRDCDAPAQTIRILHDQGSDFFRCAGGRGRVPGQHEERFASGGDSEVAIGGLRPQRMT